MSRQSVSGGITDISRFPYVGQKQGTSTNGRCSAVLVTPTTVLSAAHCFVEPDCKWFCKQKSPASVNDFMDSFFLKFDPDKDASCTEVNLAAGCVGHNPAISGPVALRNSSSSCGCSDTYVASDLAVIHLDQRIPILSIRPVDMPMTSGRLCPQDNFDATLVGYGPTGPMLWADLGLQSSGSRNFRESSGWGTSAKPGVGLFHHNRWNLFLSTDPLLSYVADTYAGSLPGDSGGGLIRRASSPNENNPLYDLVCGTISGHRPGDEISKEILATALAGAPTLVPFLLEIESVATSIWSSEIEEFLRPHVFDSEGNIRGTCSPKIPTSPVTLSPGEDTDTDGDTLPDACDPCPGTYDSSYALTGQIDPRFRVNKLFVPSPADRDGDRVPDVCDTCPSKFNPEQTDSDLDGVGDACDPCGSNGGVSDLFCCNVDAPGEVCGKGEICIQNLSSIQGFTDYVALCGVKTGHCSAPLDSDKDGRPDTCDNCPDVPNHVTAEFSGAWIKQPDSDGDGIGDACDGCPGVHDPRMSPQDEANPSVAQVDKQGLFPCNPLVGSDKTISAHDVCRGFLNDPKSFCITIPDPAGGTPKGVCLRRGKDSDGDGVWDECDNCRDYSNPDQANCNIEAEIRAGVTYPFVGDVCDTAPCTYVRGRHNAPLGSSDPPIDGVALLEMEPLLLPAGAVPNPPAYTFHFPPVPPTATVGNTFCPCGNRDGLERQPWECEDPGSSNCQINPQTLYSANNNAPWFKPRLHPNAVPGILSTPEATNAELLDLPVISANPAVTPVLALAAVPLVHWPTYNAPLSPFFGPFPGTASSLGSVCKTGNGVQGVFWTSVLSIPQITLGGYQALSSHYEFGMWGSPSGCTAFYIPPKFEEKIPCLTCCPSCGFFGIPDVSIYINPGILDPVVIAGDGRFSRVIGDVPTDLRDVWKSGASRWVTASDLFHTRGGGPDWMTTALDGVRVTSAVSLEKGSFRSLLGSVRGAPTGGPAAQTSLSVSSTEPSPREQFALAMSKRFSALFLAGGKNNQGEVRDLWRYDLGTRQWTAIPVVGETLGRVLAMTFRGPDRALYLVDETKSGWFPVGRILRIDPFTGEARVLGAWPRVQAFQDFFLSVAQSGDLVLGASQDKTKKGSHAVVVFAPSSSGNLDLRWSLFGLGALGGAPTLTRDGLTRPFQSEDFLGQRYVPTRSLPKKGGLGFKGCF